MTIMYFYCEKEISEVLDQGRSYGMKVKGGASLVWTKECSMVHSFSFAWQVTVAVSTIALEWVEWYTTNPPWAVIICTLKACLFKPLCFLSIWMRKAGMDGGEEKGNPQILIHWYHVLKLFLRLSKKVNLAFLSKWADETVLDWYWIFNQSTTVWRISKNFDGKPITELAWRVIIMYWGGAYSPARWGRAVHQSDGAELIHQSDEDKA